MDIAQVIVLKDKIARNVESIQRRLVEGKGEGDDGDKDKEIIVQGSEVVVIDSSDEENEEADLKLFSSQSVGDDEDSGDFAIPVITGVRSLRPIVNESRDYYDDADHNIKPHAVESVTRNAQTSVLVPSPSSIQMGPINQSNVPPSSGKRKRKRTCARMRSVPEDDSVVLLAEVINLDSDDEQIHVIPAENPTNNQKHTKLEMLEVDQNGIYCIPRPLPSKKYHRDVIAPFRTGDTSYCWLRSHLVWKEESTLASKTLDVDNGQEFEVQLDVPDGEKIIKLNNKVNLKSMAYAGMPGFTLPPAKNLRLRVVARCAKMKKKLCCGKLQSKLPHYYPGIITHILPEKMPSHKTEYLVSFDNGQAAYVQYSDIRLMYSGCAEDFKSLLSASSLIPNPKVNVNLFLPRSICKKLVRNCTGEVLTVWREGKWRLGKILSVDREVAEVWFEGSNSAKVVIETIFRGSPRFLKNLKRYAQLDSDNQTDQQLKDLDHLAAFEGTVETIPISNRKRKILGYKPHTCDKGCDRAPYEPSEPPKFISPLVLPLYFGWSFIDGAKGREYTSPCETVITSDKQLVRYLRATESKLHVDWFYFNSGISCIDQFKPTNGHLDVCTDPKFIDISRGTEKINVSGLNSVDVNPKPAPDNAIHPLDFHYHPETCRDDGVKMEDDIDRVSCCDCKDDCLDKSRCACWQLTFDGVKESFNVFGRKKPKVSVTENWLNSIYKARKLTMELTSGIFECNERCPCKKSICSNRVVQNGLQWPLQVFKTTAKGWAVRTMCDIPKGTFICKYAGELKTEENGEQDGIDFGDEYLADIDLIRKFRNTTKPGYESDVSDIEGMDDNGGGEGERRVKERMTREQWRIDNEVEVMPLFEEVFPRGERQFVVDAKKKGNVGRFFSHSCNPNMFSQNVFINTHDLRFPELTLFTNMDVKAGTELTWNYNYIENSVPGKSLKCACGSDLCKGRLL